MQFEELYQALSDDAKARAKKVKLLICDIDGVFSDGRIYLGNQGEELKFCLKNISHLKRTCPLLLPNACLCRTTRKFD